MADDASYASFLDKANEPLTKTTSTGSAKVDSTSQTRTKFDPTVTQTSPRASFSQTAIPDSLRNISQEKVYVSDTDSSFEPVFFVYVGDGLPSVKEFEACLARKISTAQESQGKVEELSVEEWDARGDYKDVVDAVKEAGGKEAKGEVKVFRVEVDSTRVEYYVVTVNDGKIVGVVAKAVES